MKFPMKKRFIAALLVVTVVTLAAFTFGAHPALAQGPLAQEPAEPTGIDFLVQLLFGLAVTVPGFTALGVALVNLLKIPGWVTDGNAPIVLNIFNVLSALAIGLLTVFLPSVNIPGLDVTFGQLANVLAVLLPTFALLYKWLAPYIHKAFRGVPGIGYSFSLAKGKSAG